MRAPLLFALLISSSLAVAAEQQRPLAAFDSIGVQGPINLVVTAGKPQSLLLQGDTEQLNRIETRVSGGKLTISYPTGHKHSHDDRLSDTRIVIAVPVLRSLYVEGAGLATLNGIAGDSIDIGFQGAGKLVANGSVKQLKLAAQGVGEVDTKALQAQRAHVSFEGIGAVSVHASERLDAVVQGMGSLTYYGNPKVVNKSVEGIGSVKAAAR